jgi:pimeloyl-ACP methyl ester carboxylesterase
METIDREPEIAAPAGVERPLGYSQYLTPLKPDGTGPPLFLMHAPDGLPWVYQPLVNGGQWDCPIYAAREPDLGWRQDVLSLSELATLYAIEIRKVQPRGPYSLVGYSFGGTLAFEVARHLHRDGNVVRHLVMIDTAPPLPAVKWARRRVRTRIRDIACDAYDRGWIGDAVLRLLVRKKGARANLGPGPSSCAEVRGMIMRVLRARNEKIDLDGLDFTELCAVVIERLKRPTSPIPWEDVVRFAQSEDPVQIVRGFKLSAKNLWHVWRFRTRWVYPGAITIYTGEHSRVIKRWQRYCSQPLDLRRFRVERQKGRKEHLSFMEPVNARVIAQDLSQRLDSGSAPTAGASFLRSIVAPDCAATPSGASS